MGNVLLVEPVNRANHILGYDGYCLAISWSVCQKNTKDFFWKLPLFLIFKWHHGASWSWEKVNIFLIPDSHLKLGLHTMLLVSAQHYNMWINDFALFLAQVRTIHLEKRVMVYPIITNCQCRHISGVIIWSSFTYFVIINVVHWVAVLHPDTFAETHQFREEVKFSNSRVWHSWISVSLENSKHFPLFCNGIG